MNAEQLAARGVEQRLGRRRQHEERLLRHFARVDHEARLRGEIVASDRGLLQHFSDAEFIVHVTTPGALELLRAMNAAVTDELDARLREDVLAVNTKIAVSLALAGEHSVPLALQYAAWTVEALAEVSNAGCHEKCDSVSDTLQRQLPQDGGCERVQLRPDGSGLKGEKESGITEGRTPVWTGQ